MRILNAASNNLLGLPDEIGDMKDLRVLNLANNYLRNLPRTVANLPNLSALWLNENQKKPLLVLQLDRDEKTNQEVLTCFMFPQNGPIFGPVSPAAAAALLAAAASTNNTAASNGTTFNGMESDATAGSIGTNQVSTSAPLVDLDSKGLGQPAANAYQSAETGATMIPLQPHQQIIPHHRQLMSSNNGLLDEDEGSEMLQISHTLDKSSMASTQVHSQLQQQQQQLQQMNSALAATSIHSIGGRSGGPTHYC